MPATIPPPAAPWSVAATAGVRWGCARGGGRAQERRRAATSPGCRRAAYMRVAQVNSSCACRRSSERSDAPAAGFLLLLKISPPPKSVYTQAPIRPAHQQPVYAPPAPRETAQSRPARPPRRVARGASERSLAPRTLGSSRWCAFAIFQLRDAVSTLETTVQLESALRKNGRPPRNWLLSYTFWKAPDCTPP